MNPWKARKLRRDVARARQNQQLAQNTMKNVEEQLLKLESEVNALRLQRDMLALNQGKESPVFVVLDDNGDVVEVSWHEAPCIKPLRKPTYYDQVMNDGTDS